MAEHEASHEAQYQDDPTWCKHCGQFREYWTGPCPKPGSREFDDRTKEGRRRIGDLILGRG